MAADTPARGTGERFQRQRAKTRSDLLTSARRVLAAKGYYRTKIADIAHDAGVAVGTFYLYYPTKEALFVELVENTAHLLRGELESARAATSEPRLRARAALETFFRFAHAHRELFRIVFGHGATFHDIIKRNQQLFATDIAANLADGMQARSFRPNNPEVVAQAFIGLSLQVVSWWLEREDVAVDTVIEAVLDFVFHGIEHAPGSAS